MHKRGRVNIPSPYFSDYALNSIRANASFVIAAAAWPASNRAIIVPVIFPASCTLFEMRALGANTTGNYDLGFYREDFVRISSKGSTAMAAAVLSHTLPEVRVEGGRLYYAALALSSSSGQVYRANGGQLDFFLAARIGQMASAVPLPDPFVPAAASADYLPIINFLVR